MFVALISKWSKMKTEDENLDHKVPHFLNYLKNKLQLESVNI